LPGSALDLADKRCLGARVAALYRALHSGRALMAGGNRKRQRRVTTAMADSSIHDRGSIERIYPRELFASDANANMRAETGVLRGVMVRSALDRDGHFELTRAQRQAGESQNGEGGVFLCPFAQQTGHNDDYPAPAAPSTAKPSASGDAYAAFIDDIIRAARRAEPTHARGAGDARIRGERQ
jgi:hypothetical protein